MTNINNLALFLYNATNAALLSCSVSMGDNVQHLYLPHLTAGLYDLEVVTYASAISETCALAFQFFYRVFWTQLPAWNLVIAILATATMTLGNFAAITQNNLKRFMAYSAISQAGYLIIGFLGHEAADAQAMVFYMLVYVVTNLAAFGILVLHIQESGNEDISGLRGFSRTNPIFAFTLMLALFGLAGIPPLSGFVGKFFLFSVAAKYGFFWLVAVAALNSTVSLYYYLRLVRQMYIESPGETERTLKWKPLLGVGIFVTTLASVALGLVPQFYEGIGKSAQIWIHLFSR